MVEFVETSAPDLIRATEFLHHIKPSLRDKLVFRIEKAQPFDRSVVFHLSKHDEDYDEKDDSLFILSVEYILTHSFWKA